jgi:hypothetical protein
MARNNREQREIEYRRQCVKDTWIKLGAFDVTQEQITQALKAEYGIEVDRSTVSRDLAAIKKVMCAETAEELKAFLLAEYLFVIKEERPPRNEALKLPKRPFRNLSRTATAIPPNSASKPPPAAPGNLATRLIWPSCKRRCGPFGN